MSANRPKAVIVLVRAGTAALSRERKSYSFPREMFPTAFPKVAPIVWSHLHVVTSFHQFLKIGLVEARRLHSGLVFGEAYTTPQTPDWTILFERLERSTEHFFPVGRPGGEPIGTAHQGIHGRFRFNDLASNHASDMLGQRRIEHEFRRTGHRQALYQNKAKTARLGHQLPQGNPQSQNLVNLDSLPCALCRGAL